MVYIITCQKIDGIIKIRKNSRDGLEVYLQGRKSNKMH